MLVLPSGQIRLSLGFSIPNHPTILNERILLLSNRFPAVVPLVHNLLANSGSEFGMLFVTGSEVDSSTGIDFCFFGFFSFFCRTFFCFLGFCTGADSTGSDSVATGGSSDWANSCIGGVYGASG